MNSGQAILIVSSIVLTAGIYFAGDFKGPDKEPVAIQQETTSSVGTFDPVLYKAEVLNSIDAAEKQEIEGLENALAEATADTAKLELLNALIMRYEKMGDQVLASVYSEEQAELINTSAAWLKTGDNYMSVFYAMQLSPEVTAFLVTSARNCYEKAIELDAVNTDATIGLATTYMETTGAGTEQPMQGVTLLLNIVKEDPNNVRAQLILGRYGIMSGQFEKAVQRLETVVTLDPKNSEAFFYLGEAYNGLGDLSKAIESFEKCRSLVDDPEFSARIDTYIEQLKQSKN